MNLRVGQVYLRLDSGPIGSREFVVVVELRDESHPKGLGQGFGVSAIAVPARHGGRRGEIDVNAVHPFDTWLLCATLKSHGDERWQLDTGIHYEQGQDGILYAFPGPVRGDA